MRVEIVCRNYASFPPYIVSPQLWWELVRWVNSSLSLREAHSTDDVGLDDQSGGAALWRQTILLVVAASSLEARIQF